jgi:hypothetical protein
LFGELKRPFPAYHPDQAFEVEIPEGSEATDLLALELEAVSKAASIRANNAPPWARPKKFSISGVNFIF